MPKLIIAMVGQNAEDTILLSLKSVLSFADKIIYIDGGSRDKTLELIDSLNDERIEIYSYRYRHEAKGANGFQRNRYLKILQERFLGDWCLVLDPDEVIDDNGFTLKKLMENMPSNTSEVYNVRMRHFIKDLGHEDSTLPVHYVPCRFFKITKTLWYPETEHPVLGGFSGNAGLINSPVIWHMSYCREVFGILKKYNNHLKKSEMHSPQYLREWKDAHILGIYPNSEIKDKENIPRLIREEFGI